LPNDENGKCMSFVLVGDEAFVLSEDVLRLYPNSNHSVQRRIYNYTLTGDRRMLNVHLVFWQTSGGHSTDR
jgi:hypothetical protein